jgi:predicted CoA-binding protein
LKNKILVIGASPDPHRYSYLCTKRLLEKGYDVIPLGKRRGSIEGKVIELDRGNVRDIDTVTLYLSSANQGDMEDYILALEPRRIIFNPGAENPSLRSKAVQAGITTLDACTLVMLSSGTF